MCKTIKQRVKCKAAPSIVYDWLADWRKHTALTGRKATIPETEQTWRDQYWSRIKAYLDGSF